MTSVDRTGILHRLARALLGAPTPVIDRIIGSPPIAVDGRVLDRRIQALLTIGERLQRSSEGSLRSFEPDQRRRELDRMAGLAMPRRQGIHVYERRIPGPECELRIRVYRPFGVASEPPVIVYFHGGGWVVGSLDSHDGSCRLVADVARCVVVSVDYRLAPEHPFPAAFDDCIAAYLWVGEHASDLGVDASRVGVMGDSAGGNLAAAVSLAARDQGFALPAVQSLVYPATDAYFSQPSHELFSDGFGLTRADMEWFRAQYLPDESTWSRPAASPLNVDSFDSLPPAVVATAGFDPLRDEGDLYASRLIDAGVTVRHRCYDDMVHGFFGMGLLPQCHAMATEIATESGALLHAD